MNCERCEDLLFDHAHDELEPSLRSAVSIHLGQCGACATSFCRLRADLDGIAPAHAESPRPAVYLALRRRVAAEFRPAWWRRVRGLVVRPVPAYGAVAVALVPVALWLATGLQARVPDADVLAEPVPQEAPRMQDYDASHVPGIYRGIL